MKQSNINLLNTLTYICDALLPKYVSQSFIVGGDEWRRIVGEDNGSIVSPRFSHYILYDY